MSRTPEHHHVLEGVVIDGRQQFQSTADLPVDDAVLKAIAGGHLPRDTWVVGESREARIRRLIGDSAYIDYLRTESELKERWLLRAAERAKAARHPAAFRVERQYRVGDQPVAVTNTQDEVLFALIKLGGAASLTELRKETDISDVHRVLKRLIEKNAQMASVVTLAGKKGRGGYRTTIRNAT